MAADFVELAVDSLQDYLDTNLPTKLREVETEHGLDSGDLTDPVDVINHKSVHDNRSPLLQVYEEGFEFLHRNQQIINAQLTVVLSYRSDANLASAALFMRRYVTALIRCIRTAPTLGSNVSGARIEQGEALLLEGDDSATRHLYGLGVSVLVDSQQTC